MISKKQSDFYTTKVVSEGKQLIQLMIYFNDKLIDTPLQIAFDKIHNIEELMTTIQNILLLDDLQGENISIYYRDQGSYKQLDQDNKSIC